MESIINTIAYENKQKCLFIFGHAAGFAGCMYSVAMDLEQIIIFISGAGGIWLSQDSRPAWARWACFVGVLGQPYWLFQTWQDGKMGMFGVSVAVTLSWARGFWVFWIRPRGAVLDGNELGTGRTKAAQKSPVKFP